MKGFEQFQISSWQDEVLTCHVITKPTKRIPRLRPSQWMTRIVAPFVLTAAAAQFVAETSVAQAQLLLPPEMRAMSTASTDERLDLIFQDPEVFWPRMILGVRKLPQVAESDDRDPPLAF